MSEWNNCVEQMPPNDVNFQLIVKTEDCAFVCDWYAVHEWSEEAIQKQHLWIPYTQEKW